MELWFVHSLFWPAPLGALANGGTQGNLWKSALKHAQWHILWAWGHLRKRLLQHAVPMLQRSLCCLQRREAKDNLTKLLELKSHPMFAAEKNSLKQDQMWLRVMLEREVREGSAWWKHLQWATEQGLAEGRGLKWKCFQGRQCRCLHYTTAKGKKGNLSEVAGRNSRLFMV